MQFLPKKENAPDFNDPNVQIAFVQDAKDGKTLMQKELDVNQAEQSLLQQRITMMKGFINELPASDPHYSMLIAQVHMDQIEMDELKTRELLLIDQLSQ